MYIKKINDQTIKIGREYKKRKAISQVDDRCPCQRHGLGESQQRAHCILPHADLCTAAMKH
jgi:hypothetical protein